MSRNRRRSRDNTGAGGDTFVNLITQADVSNVYWTKTGLTTPAANQIMETAVSSAHFLQGASGTGFPLAGAHNYSASIDVTPIGATRYAALGISSFGSESVVVQCDLQLGTVLGITGGGWATTTGTITPLGGGAYRIATTVTQTLVGTTGLNYFIYLLGGFNVFSYLGVITNGLTINNISFIQTA